MRINKYIAHAGVASRRKAEELIKVHRISVQQETIFGTITLRKEWTNE